MAQYCTSDDVRDVLTRDAAAEGQNNGSTLDEENIAAAIFDAQSEIDAKLATRYTVPFSPVPDLIKRITVAIAAYLADLNFRENRDMQSEMNPVLARYQRAIALLGNLSTGEAIIPQDGSDPDNPPDIGSGMRVAAVYTRPPLIDPCAFDLGYPRPGAVLSHRYAEGWGIH